MRKQVDDTRDGENIEITLTFNRKPKLSDVEMQRIIRFLDYGVGTSNCAHILVALLTDGTDGLDNEQRQYLQNLIWILYTPNDLFVELMLEAQE